MTKFTIWSEGYVVNGNRDTARIVGEVEAESFDAACEKLARDHKESSYFDKRGGRWFYWGCELFDNEQDARKNFG